MCVTGHQHRLSQFSQAPPSCPRGHSARPRLVRRVPIALKEVRSGVHQRPSSARLQQGWDSSEDVNLYSATRSGVTTLEGGEQDTIAFVIDVQAVDKSQGRSRAVRRNTLD